MGRLKNSLLKQLEDDPLFANQYWQTQDQQIEPEPELPNGYDCNVNPSALNLIKPTLWNSGKTNEIPPF